MSLIISGGQFKGRRLLTPKSLKTRPSSAKCRQAVFNICQNEMEEAFFLDLFAGSGAMGLEALSRGASFSVFVDNSKEAICCIKKNIDLLDLKLKTRTFFSSADIVLKKLKGISFDIIYMDPPYKYYEAGLEKFLFVFFESFKSLGLIKKEGKILVEYPSSFNFEESDCPENFVLQKTYVYGGSSLAVFLFGSVQFFL